MTPEKNPHSPESWSAASRSYAEHVAPSLMESFSDEFVDLLDVDADTVALEVGAGAGALTETLARRVGSLLATDFAPGMVELLSARMDEVGATNVRCQVMDGQALSLEDAGFDRAASSFAVMLFPDRARGFSELRRVLRPGGQALVSGWAGPDRFESFGLFLEGLLAAFPDMPPPPRPPAIFSLANLDSFKAEMEEAGFRDVRIDFVSRDLEMSDFDEMWALVTSGAPPIQVLMDRIGLAGEERLRDTLRGIVEERFGDGPIRLANVATVGTGRSPG
ncbi:MAG: class I SAM-dependent methyltransferase [Gemmatimonadota bacterium]